MRILIIISVFFIIFSCKKENEQHIAIGTWNKCSKDGNYLEYKITEKYIMVLTTKSEEIILSKNKVVNKKLVISEFKNGTKLIKNNDTITTEFESENQVILKSAYSFENYELNKAEFKIDEIDSLNLESWKNKTRLEFLQRAELLKCPDLRTNEEKKESEKIIMKKLEKEIEIKTE